jgi:hypothetical protein
MSVEIHQVNRWAIYIDMEGTSKIYPGNDVQFFRALNALFDAVCRIGSRVFPEEPDQLFVHQTGGDGPIIAVGRVGKGIRIARALKLVCNAAPDSLSRQVRRLRT